MRKIILLILISFSILSAKNEYFIDSSTYLNENIKIQTIDELSNETTIRNKTRLKASQRDIIEILKGFEILENQMRSFEEKKILTKLKLLFQEKYLIKERDIMEVYNNLNEVLNVPIKTNNKNKYNDY